MKKFIKSYLTVGTPKGVGRVGQKCNLYPKVVALDSDIQLISRMQKVEGILTTNDYTIVGMVECRIIFDDDSEVKTIGILTKYNIPKTVHERIDIWLVDSNEKYSFVG